MGTQQKCVAKFFTDLLFMFKRLSTVYISVLGKLQELKM